MPRRMGRRRRRLRILLNAATAVSAMAFFGLIVWRRFVPPPQRVGGWIVMANRETPFYEPDDDLHTALLITAAVLPAGWIVVGSLRLLELARRPVGLCPTCGYDLRATPDRCPECGAIPPTPSA